MPVCMCAQMWFEETTLAAIRFAKTKFNQPPMRHSPTPHDVCQKCKYRLLHSWAFVGRQLYAKRITCILVGRQLYSKHITSHYITLALHGRPLPLAWPSIWLHCFLGRYGGPHLKFGGPPWAEGPKAFLSNERDEALWGR